MLEGFPFKAEISKLLNESMPNGIDRIWVKIFGKKQAEINADILRIETQSKAEERLFNAQLGVAEKLIESGKAVYNPETKAVILLDSLSSKADIDETTNLLGCFVPAVNALEAKGTTSTKPVSNEFINRWRDEAKLIESEDLRLIWGHLLAEEVRHPDSISLRTLDVLKNLSREEVDLFVTICPFILDGWSIPEAIVVENDNYIILSEAGLISHRDTPYHQHWNDSKLITEDGRLISGHVINTGEFLIRADNMTGDIPETRVYQLTRAGAEIYKIASQDMTSNFEDITLAIVGSSNVIGDLYFFNPPVGNEINLAEDLLEVTHQTNDPEPSSLYADPKE
ncbi:DUF2806 domain-containing protein [Pantoea sp. LMR881]|uniref:DUF2806 domain-containing protein n=1 Tax=Pantoea sp. LMR881 TaxID=3014336 RepID=UPI0022AF0072|nr:DUF2806 domain-containing protein [Pantoea sp. LMR881]MCZ4061175.1 DUF2806 domain-containing protein [Pantoea sp. LMR881]MCZ4061287.1 DUF2806 domain-containing protein [Pantoea sp. LMR881]